MHTIGTWITRSGLVDPGTTASQLAAAGVTHGSIMLNDFSGARSEQTFRTHEPDRIERLAEALHANGISVSLTTWVMPHRRFIIAMGEQVRPLLERCGATGLVLDAEEPWVRAIDGMAHGDAAALIDDVVPDTPLTLTGIASANRDALGPLAAICTVWSPMCYATKRPNSLDPSNAVRFGVGRWRDKFGEPSRGWLVGLASYEQPRPASLYMQPCLDQCTELGLDTVCYWSHRPILDRADVRAVVQAAADGDPEDGGATHDDGIFAVHDLEAMPSGVRDDGVARIQGLLLSQVANHGDAVDPGKLDGKPGPNTLAALIAFQGAVGLTQTGVCDGGTWVALLRE